MLSLFFCVFAATPAMGGRVKKKGVVDTMTVARIRPANEEDAFIKVTFNQSQRFYKIPKNADPSFIELLKESEKNNKRVIIRRASQQSDVILNVRKTK
jgi:hypothetical protein